MRGGVLLPVDAALVPFVLDITHSVWFHKYHWMRRWLMALDRLFDLLAVGLLFPFILESYPYWEICLCAYIVLRLVSFALCYDTDRWECYAIRTVLPWFISGLLCNVVLMVPMIANTHDEITTIIPVCLVFFFCICYVFIFMVYLNGYDRLSFVHDSFQTRWFNIFGYMRMFVMAFDRLIDVFAVIVFASYHGSSFLYWDVCLYVYIILRLLSILVCYGTKLRECFIFWTVLLMAINGFCIAALLAPWSVDLSDGWFVVSPLVLLVWTRTLYLVVFIAIYRECSQRESD